MPENMRTGDPTGIAEGHATADPYTPTQAERKLCSALETKFNDAQQHRLPHEYQWEFNRLYLRGDQLLVRDRTTGEVTRINVNRDSRKRLHSVENILRPLSRALVGKLARIIPTMDVVPATDDESDLRGAQAAEAHIEYFDRKENMRVKYLEGQRSLQWCGTAIYILEWDPRAGRELAWCPSCGFESDDITDVGVPCPIERMEAERKAQEMQTAAQQMFEAGQQMSMQFGTQPPEQPPEIMPKEVPNLEKVHEGDCKVHRIDTRNFYPEPGIPDPMKWRYFFINEALPVTDVRADYPDKAKYIHAQDGLYTDRVLSLQGSFVDERGATTYLQDHVWLKKYHEIPSQEFPEGRLIVYCNDIILQETPHPLYKILGRLPVYPQWFEMNEGEFWGEPPITQAWSIQRERNRLKTQKREYRELTLRPRLLNPSGNKIGISEVDTTPGRILHTARFSQQPKWLENPQLPQWAIDDEDRLYESARNLFGVTEQEIGQTKGDPSGRFAAIAEAQSSEAISPIIIINNDSWKELYRGILLTCQHYYSPERSWTITGRDRARSYKWSSVSLKGGWDIQLAETDSLSKNPAIRIQQLNEWWNQGLFLDPATGANDTRTFLRLANARLPGLTADSEASEHAYWASVPDRIKRGEQVQPRPWDDPWVAQEELVAWLRGAGRTGDEPEMVIMAIAQLYMFYSSMLPFTPLTMHVAPNAAAGQLMQSGPSGQQGATGFGPGGGDGGQQPAQRAQPPNTGGPAREAAQTVQTADAQAEGAARQQTRHES